MLGTPRIPISPPMHWMPRPLDALVLGLRRVPPGLHASRIATGKITGDGTTALLMTEVLSGFMTAAVMSGFVYLRVVWFTTIGSAGSCVRVRFVYLCLC